MSARNPSKGEKAVEDIKARGLKGTVSFLQLDVTKDDSISAAAKKIEADFGRIDVLVNNAGVCFKGAPTRDMMAKTFDTNVFGVYLLTQSLVPLLQKSKDPRIINVTSGLGSIGKRADPHDEYYGQAQNETYRMSKAALNMMTTSLSHQFKDWGCKVWSFCPGYVITDLTGPEDRELRKNTGADSSETSAQGIKEIVEGKRDGEVNKFVARNGQQYPW